MKIKQKLFAAALAVSAFASAQEAPTFSLSGEFRPRTELFGNGFNFKYQPTGLTDQNGNTSGRVGGSDPYVSTSVRASLAAKYKTEGYTLYTSVQEVFKFGDRNQIAAGGNGNFRVQEAWADIKLSENSTFKIGRQPLSYDDQRILGGLGWAQQARTHDAGVFKYSKDGYNLDIGGALNTPTSDVYDASQNFSYRDMAFLRVNKKYDALNISLLGLVNTFQNSNSGTNEKASLITAGLHADYKTGIVGLSANAYIQDGERIFAQNHQDTEGGYLASLDATIKASEKITILAGGEVISGKKDDGTFGFFPLFGTNHKFNGLMDRFFVGNHAVGNGLVDLNLGLKTNISGYAVTLKGHQFSEESGDTNSLGQELDLVVAKKFNGFKLVGGYSQFFESDDYPGAEGRDTQNWAWLMLVIKPKFL